MAKESVKKESIKLDGVSFNKVFLLSHKNETEFLRTMKGEAYAHIFEGENREAKLKEVFSLVRPKKSTPLAEEPEK
jgi:hypothetical protein